jgi:hypothetical protein
MNFRAVRQHFGHHPLHMTVCVFAGLLVVTAAILGAPVLAVVGALMCGGMMLMMVWMMVGMAAKHRR